MRLLGWSAILLSASCMPPGVYERSTREQVAELMRMGEPPPYDPENPPPIHWRGDDWDAGPVLALSGTCLILDSVLHPGFADCLDLPRGAPVFVGRRQVDRGLLKPGTPVRAYLDHTGPKPQVVLVEVLDEKRMHRLRAQFGDMPREVPRRQDLSPGEDATFAAPKKHP